MCYRTVLLLDLLTAEEVCPLTDNELVRLAKESIAAGLFPLNHRKGDRHWRFQRDGHNAAVITKGFRELESGSQSGLQIAPDSQ